ncbi:MAG: hypothetical protein JNJ83_09680 [Verrucomicrobiaceae bacterium]|nr:hypothetical protein [Verrucomicrobiaceae bacterium]
MSISPTCQLQPYADSPKSREELVRWLVATEGSPVEPAWWHARLKHWWDENPWSAFVPERGWLLTSGSRVVGFQGLIPAGYSVLGEQKQACISSTWRVEPEHRNQSVAMLMQLRRMGAGRLLIDSTPTEEVQSLLQKTGWVAQREVTQFIVVPQWLTRAKLPQEKRVTMNLDEVRSIRSPFVSPHGVERWITPEYLRWYARSVTRKHVFAGVVDADGCLSSYVFLTPSSLGSWTEVDHFSTENREELHALIAAIRGKWWIKLHAFPGDETWKGARTLYQRPVQVCHHFILPPVMQEVPRRTVLAEGDWGL